MANEKKRMTAKDKRELRSRLVRENCETMRQTVYFKLTHGKRLFKMSPIHHHFEMCGWSEVKIVAVFSAVTALFGAGSFLLVLFGV